MPGGVGPARASRGGQDVEDRIRGIGVGDGQPDAQHTAVRLVDEAEIPCQAGSHRALEVLDQPQQIFFRHGLERLAAAAPDRHGLEEDLRVAGPVRVRVAVDVPDVARGALAQDGVVVEETGRSQRPGRGAALGAAGERQDRQDGGERKRSAASTVTAGGS